MKQLTLPMFIAGAVLAMVLYNSAHAGVPGPVGDLQVLEVTCGETATALPPVGTPTSAMLILNPTSTAVHILSVGGTLAPDAGPSPDSVTLCADAACEIPSGVLSADARRVYCASVGGTATVKIVFGAT